MQFRVGSHKGQKGFIHVGVRNTNVIDRSKRRRGNVNSKQQLFREIPLRDRNREGTVWTSDSQTRPKLLGRVECETSVYRKRPGTSCGIGVLPKYRCFNNHLSLLHFRLSKRLSIHGFQNRRHVPSTCRARALTNELLSIILFTCATCPRFTPTIFSKFFRNFWNQSFLKEN